MPRSEHGRVARYTEEDLSRAVRVYVRTHWGERGQRRIRNLTAPNIHLEAPTELGTLLQVVYRTTKQGDGESDYFHDFEGPRPVLAFNRGGLFILGGGYRVTTRGIEG